MLIKMKIYPGVYLVVILKILKYRKIQLFNGLKAPINEWQTMTTKNLTKYNLI